MKIGCVSDTHGKLAKHHLPEGIDVLVIAGDYMPNFPGWGDSNECRSQFLWLRDNFIPYVSSFGISRVVVVAGNHDWCHENPLFNKVAREALTEAGIVYLQESSADVFGFKFFGSPYQRWFHDWAFNFPQFDGDKQARETWNRIPKDTDILITHSPPHMVLDRCPGGRRVGCPILKEKVKEVKPRLHVFGHIHDSYGTIEENGTKFVNAALCNEEYKPVNPIQVVEV